MKLMRIVQPSDAASILEIYTPYILNTAVTFETEIPSIKAFAERIKHYTEKWPWIVYEVDGTIAGMLMLPNTAKGLPINGVLKVRCTSMINFNVKALLPNYTMHCLKCYAYRVS